MPNRDTIYLTPSSQRNSAVLVEKRDFSPEVGGPVEVFEEQLPQGSAPDMGAFGVLNAYVYNERNSVMSRQRWTEIATETEATLKVRTLDDGTEVKQTIEIVAVGTDMPAETTNLLGADRQRLDAHHEKLLVETLETLPEVKSYEQASPQYEGLDIEITKVRSGPHLTLGNRNDTCQLVFYMTTTGGAFDTADTIFAGVPPVSLGVGDDFGLAIGDNNGVMTVLFFQVVAPGNAAAGGYIAIPTPVVDNLDVIVTALKGIANVYAVADAITTVGGGRNFVYLGWTADPIGSASEATINISFSTGYICGSTAAGFNIATLKIPKPGPEDLDGFSAVGETSTRLMNSKVTVLTPVGDEQVTMRDWIPSVQAEQVLKTVEVVGTNDAPADSYLNVGIQDKKISMGKKLRTTYSVPAWQTFIDYVQDPDTQEMVAVTKTVKAASGYVVPTPEPGEQYEVRQLDHLKMLETRRAISDSILTKSFKTTKNIQYRFPGWLAPGDEYYLQKLADNTAAYGLVDAYTISGFNEKPGQTLTVPAEVITTYHPLRPLAPEVFQFYTSKFSAQVGFNYNIMSTYHKTRFGQTSLSFNDLIVDGGVPVVWACELTSGATYDIGVNLSIFSRDDPSWVQNGAGFTRTIEKYLPESVPNATTYLAMMAANTRILVGVEIEQWKYNLWKQTRTYIRMPNLVTPATAGI